MTFNHEKFIYRKIQNIEDGGTRHDWYVIDKIRREGTHFHGFQYKDKDKSGYLINKYGFMPYGIERHSKNPSYEDHTPVKNCLVTGGDCYTDGSSLQAQEMLGFIDPENDDLMIWQTLHEYYYLWIENKSGDDQ